jgi:hypothetical protein
LEDTLIGHISRDATAIEAREKPKKTDKSVAAADLIAEPTVVATLVDASGVAGTASQDAVPSSVEPIKTEEAPQSKPDRKKSTSAPPPPKRIEVQLQQTLPSPQCVPLMRRKTGRKINISLALSSRRIQGTFTPPPTVAVSALLSSASMHDSQAAIPLALITANRVTNCCDLMDAAYCSTALRAHSRSLGHVPLIDHNPRRGEKIEFAPHEAERYKERSQAERTNARLKDEFGAKEIWVRGHEQVKSHLMFGLLALTADQLM